MENNKNIFVKKKFLIYGLGKSGFASYQFLKKKNKVYLFDDYKKKIKNFKLISKLNNINKIDYDFILISPGIDINKCSLKKFLKKQKKKIITDLDIFYENYSKNKNITITGTNGKSTSAKLIYEFLKKEKEDVRLTGNIGNPILAEKKITSKTIFIIEASSYQIDYSKIFKANYAAILNISPDHLERHGTILKYAKVKFKLFKNQKKHDYSFFNKKNKYIKSEIKKNKLKSRIVNVSVDLIKRDLLKINNFYFLSDGNKENLSFIFAIVKKLGMKKKNLIKTINNFKGLKFRQEIIFKSKRFTLINDSKATSYASSVNVLKSLKKVFWILGGIPKSGDKFLLSKNQCFNFKAYIFGKNKSLFIKELKNKIKFKSFDSLKQAVQKIIQDIRLQDKINDHQTILFSPSAASFDNFKNFEDRGNKFNLLIKKLKFVKMINAR